jgi:hypothetical protein
MVNHIFFFQMKAYMPAYRHAIGYADAFVAIHQYHQLAAGMHFHAHQKQLRPVGYLFLYQLTYPFFDIHFAIGKIKEGAAAPSSSF